MDHTVAAAPEDPAVGGPSVVVDEVALVLDALPLLPADRSPLLVGERLGQQDVGVERDHLLGEPGEVARPGIGRQHHLVGIDAPAVDLEVHA